MNVDHTTIRLFTPFYREVADPRRRVIHTLGEFSRFVEKNNGVRDCFTSVYPLSGEIDRIFFDLDGKNALVDAKRMYEWLIEREYVVVMIASGKKGFHFHIMLRPRKYGDEGKELLLHASLHILQSIFGDGKRGISIDPHPIGDVRRICRIPNTLRPPENFNWCTYLPQKEFLDMNEVDVAMHIKHPHHYDHDFRGKLPELTDFPKPENFKVKMWAPIGNRIPIVPREGNIFLRNVLRPCLYRHMIGEEPRDDVRAAATVDLLQFFSPSEILIAYSQLGWRDWNPDKTRYRIEHLKGLRPYSCKRLRELGIPEVCCLG